MRGKCFSMALMTAVLAGTSLPVLAQTGSNFGLGGGSIIGGGGGIGSSGASTGTAASGSS